ncbi:serine/threonine-protein kinase [Streptomyces sp. NPDC020858]|uniref:serine/threonine-protein kinase n=1 Tax=Streptomyces sp. NPDC020858 TaxID=3365097 RepID=UPI0037BA022D
MLELRGSGAQPLEAEDPRRIGSIPLAGRLGAGGMGRVYLGVHEGRYVAVKQLLSSVVPEDEDFLRRFGHELDNLARLPEDATAPLLAGDRTARPPWFATAYIPGITLREAIGLHGGPLPAHALWLLLREAAAGLAPVHALDMVHRDLKPSNVMLTVDGLTLIDFGVARAAEQSQLTRTGMVVGTPAYMAPEQASGKRRLSGATDVFALGSVLAYAACGRPPFGDESGHGVLYRIVHEEPDLEPLRELEPDLAELVAACLDKEPEGRPTAAELLERASEHGPFTAPLWPAAITGRLTERAAFAANVQEIDVPTLPLTDEKPEPGKDPEAAGPEPVPEAAAAAGPDRTAAAARTSGTAPPYPRLPRRRPRRRGRERYDPRHPAPAVHLLAESRGGVRPARPGHGAGRSDGVGGDGRRPVGYGVTRAVARPGPGAGPGRGGRRPGHGRRRLRSRSRPGSRRRRPDGPGRIRELRQPRERGRQRQYAPLRRRDVLGPHGPGPSGATRVRHLPLPQRQQQQVRHPGLRGL